MRDLLKPLLLDLKHHGEGDEDYDEHATLGKERWMWTWLLLISHGCADDINAVVYCLRE